MNNGNERPFTVRLSFEEYEQLEAISAELGKAPAVVARECIEYFLQSDNPAMKIYRLSKPKRSHRQRLAASA